MPDKNSCPLCGHDQIDHGTRLKTISDHYHGEKEITLSYDSCQRCGTDGDFGNQNDKLISTVLDKLRAEYVKIILEEFSQNSMNFASMERALELPQRTLSKWKSGASMPTAAGVALLKFLRLFPWLVDVADYDFDFEKGQMIHIHDAAQRYGKDRGMTFTVAIVETQDPEPKYIDCIDLSQNFTTISTGFDSGENFQRSPETAWATQLKNTNRLEYATG